MKTKPTPSLAVHVKTKTPAKRPETQVTSFRNGTVKITHSRSILQSLGFQTGSVSYGAELVVDDNPTSIKHGIKRAEKIVCDSLADAIPETRELIAALAEQNRKV